MEYFRLGNFCCSGRSPAFLPYSRIAHHKVLRSIDSPREDTAMRRQWCLMAASLLPAVTQGVTINGRRHSTLH
jgi:hypothetical protein